MTEHIDRVPTKPNRYAVYDDNHNFLRYEYHVRADEPTQDGNPINKAVLDELLAASGTTTGTSDALVLAQQGFYLVDGAAIRFKLHADMNKGATINVNGTGAVAIVTAKQKGAGAKAGAYCTAIYSSTTGNFILQGSGGGEVLRFGNEPGQLSSFEIMMNGYLIDTDFSRKCM